ncbi:hypothetical protein [Nocardia mikamii]|uniref:hypothetical protein n=1 Tax=Nocardia mikamii TaxID=508464 RepID=UPI000B276482|nr:hypothetical protein [Nocardia mikamii]
MMFAPTVAVLVARALDTSMLVAILLECLTTAVVATVPNALGEEIGWRGGYCPG